MPLVYRLAARLEQAKDADFHQDDATFAHCMRSAQAAFSLDAVVTHFNMDLGLTRGHEGPCEAATLDRLDVESCKQQLRVRSALLKAEQGISYVLGVVPSVASLIASLGLGAGEAAVEKWAEKTLGAVANEQLNGGIDGMILVHDGSETAAPTAIERWQLKRLSQTADYFSVPVIILGLHASGEYMAAARECDPNAWWVVQGPAERDAREISSLPVVPGDTRADGVEISDLRTLGDGPLTSWGEALDASVWAGRPETCQEG